MKILFIMGGNADQFRALLTGFPEDLTGSDAKLLSKIVFGQNNTMACFFIACYSHWLVF